MLLTHITLEHADHPNFQIQCNLQGCCHTFQKFTVYRNHINQFHDLQVWEDNPILDYSNTCEEDIFKETLKDQKKTLEKALSVKL